MNRSERLVGLGLLGVAASCSPHSEQAAPPIFGGEGASFEAKQTPLAAAPAEVDLGPCAQATASTHQLLEDFEDNDAQLFKVTGREGWWFVATDETEGHAFPSVGDFKPSLLPEGESSLENAYALHGQASDFKDWGAQWSSTLHWVGEGLKCPFNATAFDGITFRVKGSGSLHFKLGTPATMPPEFEGECKTSCWDKHGKRIPLQPEWQQVVVRWNKLQQEGWGTDVDFDAARVLSIDFAVHSRDLPVDFWLDDIIFLVPGESVPDLLSNKATAEPPSTLSEPPVSKPPPANLPSSAPQAASAQPAPKLNVAAQPSAPPETANISPPQ